MSITKTADVIETVDGLVVDYTAAVALVEEQLAQNTQTAAELEHLRANLDGVVSDFRTFRRDLDRLDSLDLLATQQNAARILQIWTWERTTRRDAQDFAGGVVEVSKLAKGLVVGSDRGTYTTRAGETLQSIAAAQLGGFAQWPRILAANPGLSPGLIPAGTTLIIPEKR